MSNVNIYNEAYNLSSNPVRQTGSDSEAIESVASMFLLHRDGDFFEKSDLKDLSTIKGLIKEGRVRVMYEMYEVQPANTDAQFFESGNYKAETKKAVKGLTFEHYLSFTSHAALKTYQESAFDRVIEITEDNLIIATQMPDGKVRGQKIRQFDVGIRMPATADKPPYSPVTVTYDDYDELEDRAAVLIPDYNPNIDLEGVFEIDFDVASLNYASGTGIEITAKLTSFGKNVIKDGSTEQLKVSADVKIGEDANKIALPNSGWTVEAWDLVNSNATFRYAGAVPGLTSTADIKSLDLKSEENIEVSGRFFGLTNTNVYVS